MRLSSRWPFAALSVLGALVSPIAAEDVLQSSSLTTCQENSGYQASVFSVVFTPKNNTAAIHLVSMSTIQGYVNFDISITAYGYEIIRKTVDPCSADLAKSLGGLCPMSAGKTENPFNLEIPPSAVSQIPGIAYTFPDLDAKVRILINMTKGEMAGQTVACIETDISNGQTVDLTSVKWAAAAVSGVTLLSSAIIFILGHLNAASHVAVNAISLIGYFQSQAMIGLCAVPLPPVVRAWTQDFQWSLGIINVDFMQNIFTWYQRATGGTPAVLFRSISKISVSVQKRAAPLLDRAATASMPVIDRVTRFMQKTPGLVKRSGNLQTNTGSYLVFGVQRVAYQAQIETTNLFLTAFTFFLVFVVATILVVLLFRGLLVLALRAGWVKDENEQIRDFRNGWATVLKGILYRICLIGYPAAVIFGFWELTQGDSPAEMVLAVFWFLSLTLTLAWAAYKIITIASRSIHLHHNPAYILFSDPRILNKWGFLYIQFRASGYYFIAPMLAHVLIKGMFISFGQRSGVAQAVGFIIIEAAALIGTAVLRPWMDKSINSFNIAICSVNFVNAVFLFVFTDVFDQPGLVTGVIGVVLWIMNAAFTLIFLLMILISTIIIFFKDNPDARYQYMADDRASFMKSHTALATNTELDALGATARGSGALDLDDDDMSLKDPVRHGSIPVSARSSYRGSYHESLRSPHNPSQLTLPQDEKAGYRAPSPLNSTNPPGSARSNTHASPWQRGAGYDH
jgi:hypothetical protein